VGIEEIDNGVNLIGLSGDRVIGPLQLLSASDSVGDFKRGHALIMRVCSLVLSETRRASSCETLVLAEVVGGGMIAVVLATGVVVALEAFTIAEALSLPPAPEQVIVYVDVPTEAGICVDSPESGCAPDHAPDAVHEVAL
jgi:hypothetical protein